MKSLADYYHLWSSITAGKILNASNVLASYYRSRYTGLNDPRGLPISIAIEPTTSCNLRCPECPSGLRAFTRPTGMLDEQLFRKIINELSDTLVYLTFYFQGEPYLHSSFTDLIRYASDKNIYTATSTNAHYLDDDRSRETVESGLKRLIISIDGTTQDTYQQYRIGGSLEKVLEGTRNLIKWKRKLKSVTPYLVFQFLVVRPNQHQIEEVRQLGKELGVNRVSIKTAQIYDYQNGSPLMPTLEKYSRYKLNGTGKYTIKNPLNNHCWKMWHSCVITWDGKVVPCCFDKDAHHVMGDLNKSDFNSIWYSEPYRLFRANLMQARSKIEMCTNCTEGTKVWA